MKRSNAIALFVVCCAHTAFVAHSNSPSIVIDGHLEDEVWRNLSPEILTPSEVGVPRETGGQNPAIAIWRMPYILGRLACPPGPITPPLFRAHPNAAHDVPARSTFWADM